jgi:hypothetical protein
LQKLSAVPIRLGLTALVAVVAIGAGVLPRLSVLPQSAEGPAAATPDPALWSFERPVVNRESLEVAEARGRVHQDPELRRLRQAVLGASSRLEFSPCDRQLRPPLRQAIGTLLVALRDAAGQTRETAIIDGSEVDATAFLNTRVAAVISEAREVGLVYREDVPAEVGVLFPPRPILAESGRFGGRFACVDGGRG